MFVSPPKHLLFFLLFPPLLFNSQQPELQDRFRLKKRPGCSAAVSRHQASRAGARGGGGSRAIEYFIVVREKVGTLPMTSDPLQRLAPTCLPGPELVPPGSGRPSACFTFRGPNLMKNAQGESPPWAGSPNCPPIGGGGAADSHFFVFTFTISPSSYLPIASSAPFAFPRNHRFLSPLSPRLFDNTLSLSARSLPFPDIFDGLSPPGQPSAAPPSRAPSASRSRGIPLRVCGALGDQFSSWIFSPFPAAFFFLHQRIVDVSERFRFAI